MKKFSNLIVESKSIEDLPTSKVAILFNDIKGSSEIWAKSEDKMFDALNELDDLMNDTVDRNDGMIVKTIGDSFMCSYEGSEALFNAVKTATEVQRKLIDSPIKAGDNKIKVRIGICYGDIYIKETKIQGKELKDFFGNSVNTASRLESKVSEKDGFAFSFLINIDNEEEIRKYLENNDVKIEVIEYDDKCDKEEGRKRSGRLLTDLQINSCRDVDELKGVSSVRVYKCEFKNA